MGRSFRSLARGIAFALVGMLALVHTAPLGAAYHVGSASPVSGMIIQQTVSLPENNWTGFTWTLGAGDTLTYQIAGGDAFDVYFVPDDGLTDYASDTALTFSLYRQIENTFVAQGTFQVSQAQAGHVTVIVDNVDFSGAVPTGTIMVTVQMTRTAASTPFGGISPLLIGGIIGVIILVVIIAAAVAMSRRKKALPPPAQPPAAPGYAPGYPQYPQQPQAYQQPPQQGWPPQPPPPGNP